MMKSVRGAAAALLCLALLLPQRAAAQDRMQLSLDECLVGAMRHNLRIAAELLSPEISDLTVLRAGEKFLPQLSFAIDTQETNTASYSFIDAADQVSTSLQDYGFTLSQSIPSGGYLTASLSSYKNENNRRFQTINPRYGSTLRFNFTQPLLKNFGWKISRREIIVARNNRAMSESQFLGALSDIIYSVEEAYWNLVYSIEYLRVREQSLQLARDLLEESLHKVEVGTMAPIDLFTAEAEVATREADILQAQVMVKNSEDRLKSILNLPELEEKGMTEVVPTDKPSFDEVTLDYEEALAVALEKRPDLQASRINLDTRQLDVTYAANQLLPELNLTASYWSPGISGDRILYLDNNAFSGVVVGTVPGSSNNALKDAVNFKYNNWTVALTLDIPLNTILSRADHRLAKARLKQAMYRLEDQEREVVIEIKSALRSVETGFKRMQAYKSARELAEKKLDAEGEKLKVGKSTSYLLLQYQRDLADARTTELKAMVDYTLSLANLDKAMGTTLDAKNINIADIGSE
jgi:outer membrane protein TolC